MVRRGAVQRSKTERGRIVFDERDLLVLKRRDYKGKIRFAGYLFVLFVTLFSMLTLLLASPGPIDPWDRILSYLIVAFLLAVALILALGSLGTSYVLLYENGIEFCGGLLYPKRFNPFGSVEKVYTRMYDDSGIKVDYTLLVLDDGTKRSCKVLGESLLVDTDGFFELLGKKVPIDSGPVEVKQLERRLREDGILGRFGTLGIV